MEVRFVRTCIHRSKCGLRSPASTATLQPASYSSMKSRKLVVPYWLAAEAAAAATDLAEYLGTVIALNLIFQIPLLYASIFGAADVIILLALTSERFRIVEYFFMLFVSIIALGFLYQVIIVGPSLTEIAYHSVAVSLSGKTALLVVGIIGATVMPHALFVHSTLTRDKLTTGSVEEKRMHRRLHLREVIITLTIAGLVNVAILVCAEPQCWFQQCNLNRSILPANATTVWMACSYRICDNTARLGPRLFDHRHACRHGDDGWAAGHSREQEPSEDRDEVSERLPYYYYRPDRAQSLVVADLQPGNPQLDDSATDDSSDSLHEQEKGDGRVREQQDYHDSWDTRCCYHSLPELLSALHLRLGCLDGVQARDNRRLLPKTAKVGMHQLQAVTATLHILDTPHYCSYTCQKNSNPLTGIE